MRRIKGVEYLDKVINIEFVLVVSYFDLPFPRDCVRQTMEILDVLTADQVKPFPQFCF